MSSADVAAATKAALQTDRTVRCVANLPYGHESRRSPDVLHWVDYAINKLCRAMLESLCLPPDDFSVRPTLVQMSKHHVKICFDFLLPGCKKEDEIRASESERPVHYAFRKHGVYYIRRHRGLDEASARKFRHFREYDHGPLPLFIDTQDPPLYCDGVRLEKGVNYEEPVDSDEENENETETENGHAAKGGEQEEPDAPKTASTEDAVDTVDTVDTNSILQAPTASNTNGTGRASKASDAADADDLAETDTTEKVEKSDGAVENGDGLVRPDQERTEGTAKGVHEDGIV